MEEIRIVPMAESHLDALARIEKLCFSQPWSRAGLRDELTNPAACFLAAECGGAAVGYAGMFCAADECYVANVAVHPDFRGRGIGGRLLRALEESAKERGGAFLSLEVRESNLPALALYRSHGFVRAGLRKNFYREPVENALILTKYF